MIVVDASALVDLLVPRQGVDVSRRLLGGDELHAPYLMEVEVAQGLRRLENAHEISRDRATEARRDAANLPIIYYPHAPLLPRAWELRKNATVYDGVYLALAEILDIPLVTCDRRLATIPGHEARVEVFAPM